MNMIQDHTLSIAVEHMVDNSFFLESILKKPVQTTLFSPFFWIFIIFSASLCITVFLIFVEILPDDPKKEIYSAYDTEFTREFDHYKPHRYTEAQRAILQFQRKKQEPQLISYTHPCDEDKSFDFCGPDLPSIIITPSIRYRFPSRRKYSSISNIHASDIIRKHKTPNLDTNWTSDEEAGHLILPKTPSLGKSDIDVRDLKLKKSFTGADSLEQPSILYPRTNSSGIKDTDISYEHAMALPFRF